MRGSAKLVNAINKKGNKKLARTLAIILVILMILGPLLAFFAIFI